MRKIALLTSLAAMCALPAAAWAQDAAAPPAEPAPAAEPAPVAEPVAPPAAAASVEAEAAPAEEAAPAPAPEEADGPAAMPGWIRVDSDGLGVQFWGGGTYPLSDSVGLAFDMYVAGTTGEVDVGPAIAAGPVTITPMIGIAFDWANQKAASLIPQLFVTGGPDPIYGELWVQYFANKVFTDGATNQLYLRLFADYKLNDYIALGPQVELTHDSEADVVSLPVGGNVLLSNVGVASSWQLFLGYETKDTASDNHLAGRLTFIHNF